MIDGDGETEVLGEKTCPSAALYTTDPHDLTRDGTPAARMGSQQLIAWATERQVYSETPEGLNVKLEKPPVQVYGLPDWRKTCYGRNGRQMNPRYSVLDPKF
jgi:hypothetical protein